MSRIKKKTEFKFQFYHQLGEWLENSFYLSGVDTMKAQYFFLWHILKHAEFCKE